MKAHAKHKETKQAVLIKIEPSTLEQLDELADLAGTDRSKLIRKFINDGLADNDDFSVKKLSDETLKEIHEVKTEIHRIGVNVNQIARQNKNHNNLIAFCKDFMKLTKDFEENFVMKLQ